MTILNVLLTQAIDVDAAQAGMTFKSLLDDPVMMNGKVVVPRNAAVALQAVKVQQAGAVKGADKITLKANSFSFGGRKYDIVTSYVEQQGAGEGKKTGRKVLGGAGLGAVIGIAGGGSGAPSAPQSAGNRRCGGQPGHGTPQAPRGDAAAVSADVGGHRPALEQFSFVCE